MIDDDRYQFLGRTETVLQAIAVSPFMETTNDWVAVLAADMDEVSSAALYRRVHDRNDDLSALGLSVLFNDLCFSAFGVDSTAASRLAATYVKNWFPFRSWVFRQGIRITDLSPAEILTGVYGWAMDNVADQEGADKVNRKIFRVSEPWA
jgi:hypothetical protein